MRQLVNLDDERTAIRLLALLRERRLEARVDRDTDGQLATWTVWILSEDDVEQAGSLWREFREHPERFPAPVPESSGAAQSSFDSQSEHRNSEMPDECSGEFGNECSEESLGVPDSDDELDHDGNQPHSTGNQFGQPLAPPLELGSIPVTLFIVGFSILVSLLSHFGTPRGTRVENQRSLEQETFETFALVDPNLYAETNDPLISVKSGQIWRVISSVFVHGDSLHLAFNVVWLFFLGSALEKLEGSLGILKIVVVAHLAGLCAQVFLPTQSPLPISLHGNPLLIGSSGMVYGLFGYLWLRPKFNTKYPLFLVHSNLVLMLGWLIFCLTPVAQPFAGGAQIAGLLAGIFLASLPSKSQPSR